jgi:RNAse (barnase) inhibitor barstar
VTGSGIIMMTHDDEAQTWQQAFKFQKNTSKLGLGVWDCLAVQVQMMPIMLCSKSN